MPKNERLKCKEMCKCKNCKNIESEDLINLHDDDLEETEEHQQWLMSLSENTAKSPCSGHPL